MSALKHAFRVRVASSPAPTVFAMAARRADGDPLTERLCEILGAHDLAGVGEAPSDEY